MLGEFCLAKVVGGVGADKDFISKYPIKGVKSADDIQPELDNAKRELSERKSAFEKGLPAEISSEKKKLGKLENELHALVFDFDKKETVVRSEIAESRLNAAQGKITNRFVAGIKYIFRQGKLAYLRHFQRPSALAREEAKIHAQQSEIHELETNHDGVFNKRNEDIIDRLELLKDAGKTREYAGAKGEL